MRFLERLAKSLAALFFCATPSLGAQHDHQDHSDHQQHNMVVTAQGAVMNENTDQLPRNCETISRDYEITVRAGRAHASAEPGQIFGMQPREIRIEPCSRVRLTLVNEDEVRHQWMIHGLPKYLYPAGMFHIEANGGQSMSGSFIAPSEDRSYLLHCDIAQHMEKGMRGQLIVGAGSGDLWGISEISEDYRRSSYLPPWAGLAAFTVFALGLSLAIFRRHDRS